MLRMWTKRRRTIPVDTICRNCGTQTVGRYCHVCGQDIFAGQGQPVLKFIGQLLTNAFALDGKTPVTLWSLIARPGFLPGEYRIGRINRYVHPVKLFWMATLIFFALLIAQVDAQEDRKRAAQQDTTTELPVAAKDSENNSSPSHSDDKFDLAKSRAYIAKYGPFAVFLIIPVFALLLALFFWRNKFYYMYHMVFALHFHTFLWIYFSLLYVVDIFTPDLQFPDWLSCLLFFIPGVYLSVAFRRFYHTKTRWSAVWKATIITLQYMLLNLIFIVALTFAILLIFFPEEL